MKIAARSTAAGVLVAMAAALQVVAPPAEAAFPGRNGRIAFAGLDGIVTINPDGSGRRALTAGDDVEPSWSPAGDRIAFVRLSGEAFEGDVHVMNADGSNPHRITQAGDDHYPAWSPDGSRIAFSRSMGEDFDYEIHIANADGTAVQQLTDSDFNAYDPAWSPQGDRIAFSRDDGLFTIRPDGTGLTRLTTADPQTSAGDFRPDWSPDGQRLAFERGGSACTLRVWTMTAAGGNQQQVPLEGCNVTDPAWSPDGTRIAVAVDVLELDFDTPREGIYTVRPDGTGRTRVTSEEGFHLDWQPIPIVPDPAIQAACPHGAVPRSDFADVAGNLHEAAIHCMVWWQVTSGITATSFAPRQQVNRAQMATFIARAVERSGGSLPPAAPQGFTDIGGSVHADRINQLAAAGIVRGTTATTYSPRSPVSRAQMATFLVRAYEHRTGEELAASQDYFTDDNGNPHEANINKVAEARFAAGTSPTTFDPRAAVRRDQMASFLMRMISRMVDDGVASLPAS